MIIIMLILIIIIIIIILVIIMIVIIKKSVNQLTNFDSQIYCIFSAENDSKQITKERKGKM